MFEDVIKHYLDFPKPGIDFIDVLPFLQDKKAFAEAIRQIDRCCTTPNVATVEARGFLFAAPLLTLSDHVRTIVPIRKKGKLPFAEGDLAKVEIEKEYGSDQVFYRRSDLAASTTCSPPAAPPSASPSPSSARSSTAGGSSSKSLSSSSNCLPSMAATCWSPSLPSALS